MALQFKRGLNSNRTSVTPEEGEFIYTTDEKKVYIGDGVTPGGILVTGGGISSVGWDDVTDKPTIPDSLFDLGVADGAAGQVLTTNGLGSLSFSTIVSGGTIELDGLTDVELSSPLTTGQILKYDGVKWINDSDNSGEIYTLPTASTTVLGGVKVDGATITINGDGVISAAASGGSLPSRNSSNATTASLNNGQQGTLAITGFKGYVLYKIATTHAAWVRIYTSTAARDNDAARLEGEDPLPGAGVIAEIITTGSETVLITPGALGFNDETPVDSNIYLYVTNKSGSPAEITVTLTLLQLEA